MKTKRIRRKHHDLLHVFATANPKFRKAIVKNADDDFIQALLNISKSILYGNKKDIPLKTYRKLYKHRNSLRKMAECCYLKRSQRIPKARHQLANDQVGGVIPFIAMAAAPLIADSVVGKLFDWMWG